ncbi:hypothetical protein [Streptomyces sp. TP-A0356]|uniref:hypothetical protein n=1 Tax=Streptomyces sp. TP-A0356 TaxID=1359208 RepID=UPI0018FEAE7D|nr:hypothetical protein [Streptomyces sp. TP-A0356]
MRDLDQAGHLVRADVGNTAIQQVQERLDGVEHLAWAGDRDGQLAGLDDLRLPLTGAAKKALPRAVGYVPLDLPGIDLADIDLTIERGTLTRTQGWKSGAGARVVDV